MASPATAVHAIALGTFPGALGMDFDVNRPIIISEIGVFDSSSNGLSNPISARLYNRAAPGVPLATLIFNPGDPDSVVGGSRFKVLGSPITLPQGFQGSIVAEGYSAAEPNGNQGSGSLGLTTNSAGGAISFVGGGRFDGTVTPGTFPANIDGGPANRYAAGTFNFAPTADISVGNVPLIQSTAAALFSQGGFPVGAAVDGNPIPAVGTGWAGSVNPLPDVAPSNIGVFETLNFITSPGGDSLLTFNITSGGFGTHTVGRFRISATTDAQSEFANGLASGGDVTANWTVLDALTLTSSNPTTVLTKLGDGSILASGGIAEVETYTIRATSAGLDGITGFRIELIEDPSFPANGPGRASNGNYVLSEFTVSTQIAAPEPATAALLALGSFALLRRRRNA